MYSLHRFPTYNTFNSNNNWDFPQLNAPSNTGYPKFVFDWRTNPTVKVHYDKMYQTKTLLTGSFSSSSSDSDCSMNEAVNLSVQADPTDTCEMDVITNLEEVFVDYAERFNIHERDLQAKKFYKQQLAQRWDADEIRLSEDKNEFDKMTPRHKLAIEDLVSFFAPGDGLVCEQVDQLKAETKDFYQRAFLGEQYSIEVVHARAYTDIIMTFFDEPVRKRIFASVNTLPCVRDKAEFIVKYMEDKTRPLSLRYIAAAVSEGVFFVSLFAVIFYFREKKVLSHFCSLNEQVSKDEKLHRDFDIMMGRRGFRNGDFTRDQAYEIVKEGIRIEKIHIRYILRMPIDDPETDEIGGMTISNMDRFIHTLADQIMVGLGFEACFTYKKGESPSAEKIEEFSPPWMKGLSMIRKPNFYEVLTGNYSLISQRERLETKINFEDMRSLGI